MRERWDSRTAFVLAAIGSAIGLGNVWRFPYVCFKCGGGAFLIPYFIALFTAGIPLLILEFSLGHKFQKGAPSSFAKIGKNKEWLGWFALLVAFGITSYYAVIMGWCLNYAGYSFKLSWGANTEDFFMNKFLSASKSPFELGGLKLGIIIALAIVWIFIIRCIWRGPKTVGKVVWVTVTLPWLILIVFVVRGLTLPGAIEGLNAYLTPNFSALRDLNVWKEAYGQVFFSLTIGFGVMIAYASYLPEKSDIVNNALIIALADAGTAFLAGFAVFSTLGYYAYVQGVPVAQSVKSSIPLAFIVYPTIINLLPFASKLFGVLFFVMLLTLGIDSAFSLVEAMNAGVMDKWNMKKRWKVNISFGVIAFLAGIIFTTRGGFYWVDIVDNFMNFGLIIVALIECIVLGYFFKLSTLREHCNTHSEIRLGRWWDICIKFVTPVLLGGLIVAQIIERIKAPYGWNAKMTAFRIPEFRDAEFIGGWFLLILFLIISFVLMKVKSKRVE